jgi:hypothetical protein
LQIIKSSKTYALIPMASERPQTPSWAFSAPRLAKI